MHRKIVTSCWSPPPPVSLFALPLAVLRGQILIDDERGELSHVADLTRGKPAEHLRHPRSQHADRRDRSEPAAGRATPPAKSPHADPPRAVTTR